MTKKLRVVLDTDHMRRVWSAVLAARDEVRSWPAWKRGDASPPENDEGDPEAPHDDAAG